MAHNKEITGHITVVLRFPITFNVKAENVEYEDENGKPYFEEEWEYSPDEVIVQNEEIKNFVKENEYYIEEIIVDEV